MVIRSNPGLGARGLATRRARRAAAAVGVLLGAWMALATSAPARAQGTRVDAYPVSAFVFEYGLPHPDQPTLAELGALEVELRVATGGLLPPYPTAPSTRFALAEVPAGSKLYPAALSFVTRQILAVFTERGIDGVVVTLPDLEEQTGRDLRTPGDTRMRVRVWTGRVEAVSTVADGDRFALDGESRINHPAHRFVREGSPATAGGRGGLLRVQPIEDHAQRLSRHPGRRVDAILRPGTLPGTTRVDYHVAESKPWMVYAQVSNTGTEATTRWRQRFGFSHNQLTGHDDVLRFDYVTGDFDSVHGVWGSYEAPIYRVPWLRGSLSGTWSEYDASEVGLGGLDVEGDQWQTGGRLIANVFQFRELFVDVFGGAYWRSVSADNLSFGDVDEDFFLPEAGLRIRRDTLVSSAALEISFDTNLSGVAGSSASTMAALGNLDVDEDFTRMRWQGALSIFLEPALRWARFADPSTPASSTLAHELLITTQGQVSFGDRLVPQFQKVAGGLATVRGYEQSDSAGDNVVIGSAEYRLHVPRLLGIGRRPLVLPVVGKLKLTPEHVYDRPDWDLIVKAFVDAGRVETVDRLDFEQNDTLISMGLGLELQVLRFLSARLDLAFPQRRLEGRDIDRPEIHTLITVMY